MKRVYIVCMRAFLASVLCCVAIGCSTLDAEGEGQEIFVNKVYITIDVCFEKKDERVWDFYLGKPCPIDRKLILRHIQILGTEIQKHPNEEIQKQIDAGKDFTRAVFTMGEPTPEEAAEFGIVKKRG